MKTIILEDGTKVEISDESYEALQKAVQKPVWKDVAKERMPVNNLANITFSGFGGSKQSWLNNEQSQKEFDIYLHMLLWKETYDKDFVPDWEDVLEYKWYIYYDNYPKCWTVAYWTKYQENMQVYVSTEEKAKQMLEDLKSIGVL
jgi:hypothetical protein